MLKKEFASRKYPSLEAVLGEFLGGVSPKPKVAAAAFGVAGPVVERARASRRTCPGSSTRAIIARKLGIKRVTLLNDLVALSLGALHVPRASCTSSAKRRGCPEEARRQRRRDRGGHGPRRGDAHLGRRTASCRAPPRAATPTSRPRDDLEVELLQFLRDRFGHVSWERILSGSGLGNLYDFFRQAKGIDESAAERRGDRGRRQTATRRSPSSA